MSLTWIDTAGGVHLLIPIEELHSWRGIDGWIDGGTEDDSDYARACRIGSWVGLIGCGNSEALVFSGDVGPVAWLPDSNLQDGSFLQWLGADSDEQILTFANSQSALDCLNEPGAESLEFATGRSGTLRLMSAADGIGQFQNPYRDINLRPGKYSVRCGYHSSQDLMLVVRRFQRLP